MGEKEMISIRDIILAMEAVDSIDQQTLKFGVYSIAFMGLATALRIVRPFKRFSRPSDIPNRFIRLRTKLHGNVERIEPAGPLLMVQHKPIIHIFRTKVDSLPVKISGVTVNNHGVSWLQSIVSGNNVTIIPILKQKDCIQCEVTMNQKAANDKVRTLNIGADLVKIGFGKVDQIDKTLSKNPSYQTYIKQLKSAEYFAEKKRLGYWYYIKVTQQTTLKLINYITIFIKSRSTKTPKKSEIIVSTSTATKTASKIASA